MSSPTSLLKNLISGSGLRTSVLFWAGKGSATILDQALVSGSNFLLSITLARLLGPESYGAYTLVFIVFLLAAQVHQALVLEPMSVFGSSSDEQARRRYVSAVVWLSLILCAGMSLMIGLAGTGAWLFNGKSAVAGALFGLMIALPCILSFWVARCAVYLNCAPGTAVKASALYCVFLLCGLVAVHLFRLLSPFATFCLMALAACMAMTYVFVALRVQARPVWADMKPMIWRHWDFGRWLLGGLFIQWVQINSSYMFSAAFLGMREVGGYGVLSQFVLPVTHIMQGSGRLILPRLSEHAATNGAGQTRAAVARISTLFFAGALIYWAILALWNEPILGLIYGRKYLDFAPYLPWATLCMLFAAAVYPIELGLRAIIAPSVLFWMMCFSAVLTLMGISAGIPVFGLPAIFATTAVVSVLYFFIALRAFLRRTRREPAIVETQDQHVVSMTT
jgi:O-antigen/teichoic acid export membrane protein